MTRGFDGLDRNVLD